METNDIQLIKSMIASLIQKINDIEAEHQKRFDTLEAKIDQQCEQITKLSSEIMFEQDTNGKYQRPDDQKANEKKIPRI